MECIPPFVFVDMLCITLAEVIDLGPLVREICFSHVFSQWQKEMLTQRIAQHH